MTPPTIYPPRVCRTCLIKKPGLVFTRDIGGGSRLITGECIQCLDAAARQQNANQRRNRPRWDERRKLK